MAGSPKGKRVNPRANANNTKLTERRLAVLAMRGDGMSYRAIADILGVAPNTVRNDETYMLAEYEMPAVDEYRRRVIFEAESQLNRLKKQLATPQYLMTNKGEVATGPDGQPILDTEKYVKIELAIMKLRDQLIRMLGANAAEKTELTITEVTQDDLAIRDLINAQTARNALAKAEFKAKQEPTA